jgi:hypothetical protein
MARNHDFHLQRHLRLRCSTCAMHGAGESRNLHLCSKDVGVRGLTPPPLSFEQLTEAHLIPPNLERAPLETIEP